MLLHAVLLMLVGIINDEASYLVSIEINKEKRVSNDEVVSESI